MNKYKIIRTKTADDHLHEIIMRVAENWGRETALKKLDEIEHQITLLEDNPYLGYSPHYSMLRRQGYRVLTLEKNLLFYRVNEEKKEITVYAVVDQRQDYLNIIHGL